MKIITGARLPEPGATLLKALRNAHLWAGQLRAGAPLRQIAAEAGLSENYIARTIPLVTTLSTGSMMSADVAGRARAVGALVGAGVALEQAMQLVGWGERGRADI